MVLNEGTYNCFSYCDCCSFHGNMIAICDLQCQLPMNKVTGEAGRRSQLVINYWGIWWPRQICLTIATVIAEIIVISQYSQVIFFLTMSLSDRVAGPNYCHLTRTTYKRILPWLLVEANLNATFSFSISMCLQLKMEKNHSAFPHCRTEETLFDSNICYMSWPYIFSYHISALSLLRLGQNYELQCINNLCTKMFHINLSVNYIHQNYIHFSFP